MIRSTGNDDRVIGRVFYPTIVAICAANGDIGIAETLQAIPRLCAQSLDDLDGEVRSAWYEERMGLTSAAWSGNTLTVVLEVNDADVIEIPWRCRACRVDRRGRFRIELLGISTLKPRAGLQTGQRAEFFAAPEPGLQIRFQNGGFTMPEGYDTPPMGGGGTGGGGGGGTTGGGGNTPFDNPHTQPTAVD